MTQDAGATTTRPGSPAPIPPRGLNAIGSAALAIQAIVVLLAVFGTLALQRGHRSGVAIGLLVALVVALVLAAGMLRRPGGRTLASGLQVATIAAGVISWPLYAIGVIFGGLWVYWLRQWPKV